MYFISDGIYGFVYYILGYRKVVVMNNLLIAFPDKTEQERVKIAKDFYHNFIDTILEMVKMISISEKELTKRFTSNIETLNALYDTGVNVQLMSGHFFNWELVNFGISNFGKYPFVGVFMPVSNKAFTKIMYDMRGRFGTILIPATEFQFKFHRYVRGRYALGLGADQNPGNIEKAYWVNFFNRLTPFNKGPEKGAKRNKTAIVFTNFYKTKRGHYHTDFELLTTDPNAYKEGELTRIFAASVENAIRKIPANYLWSHRRWKYVFNEEKHRHLVVA